MRMDLVELVGDLREQLAGAGADPRFEVGAGRGGGVGRRRARGQGGRQGEVLGGGGRYRRQGGASPHPAADAHARGWVGGDHGHGRARRGRRAARGGPARARGGVPAVEAARGLPGLPPGVRNRDRPVGPAQGDAGVHRAGAAGADVLGVAVGGDVRGGGVGGRRDRGRAGPALRLRRSRPVGGGPGGAPAAGTRGHPGGGGVARFAAGRGPAGARSGGASRLPG